VMPARGQTVLVRNDPGFMGCVSGTDDGVGGDVELVYFMKRAAGQYFPPPSHSPNINQFLPFRWRNNPWRLLPN
jgi:hypothetical protein